MLNGWTSINYNGFWDCFNPLNIILLVLCMYSLVVNYSFGHPTFWRKSKSLSKIVSLDDSFVIKGSTNRNKKIAHQVLENLNADLLLRTLGYLSPYELTVMRQVSRKHREVAENSKLWSDFESYLPANDMIVIDQRLNANICPLTRYFYTLEQLMLSMLRDESKLIVKLHNTLYDLTQFAIEHPGGSEVLTEYRGKDATRIFDLASHSQFALEIGENLVCFDPIVYKGAAGVPQGVQVQLALIVQ